MLRTSPDLSRLFLNLTAALNCGPERISWGRVRLQATQWRRQEEKRGLLTQRASGRGVPLGLGFFCLHVFFILTLVPSWCRFGSCSFSRPGWVPDLSNPVVFIKVKWFRQAIWGPKRWNFPWITELRSGRAYPRCLICLISNPFPALWSWRGGARVSAGLIPR